MYVALGQVLKERNKHGDVLSFDFRIPEQPTDEKIRRAFFSDLDNGLALALCEPPNSLQKMRKIPLVLRQPHWLLAPISVCFTQGFQEITAQGIRSLHLSAKQLAEILGKDILLYCYAENTTSGNFVRNFIKPLLSREPYSISKIDTPDLGEEDRFQNELLTQHLPRRGFQATFTPWHLEPASGAIALAEYASPVRDITALLVPDSDDDERLFRSVLEHLNKTLAHLFSTQGVDHKVRELLQYYREPIRLLFKKYPPQLRQDTATNLDANTYDDSLARKLACYLRRGCYFPYRTILESIRPELERMFKDEAQNAIDQAAIGFTANLSHFFGTPRSWSDLSFSGRRSVHVNWQLDGHVNDQPLWCKLKHWYDPAGSAIAWPQLLAQVLVKVDQNEVPQPLELLHREGRETTCSENSHQSPEDCNQRGNACFLCHIGGYPSSIVRQARRLLLERLKEKWPGNVDTIPADEILLGHKVTGVASNGTLICWDEVKEMIVTFCDEMQTPTTNVANPPCFVCVHNEIVDVAKVSNKLLVIVYWRDQPKRNTGMGGNASAIGRLRTWANRLARNTPVEFVCLWFASDGICSQETWQHIWPKSCTSANKSDLPDGLVSLWDHSEVAEIRAGHQFAYVALFDTTKEAPT